MPKFVGFTEISTKSFLL